VFYYAAIFMFLLNRDINLKGIFVNIILTK